jgi:hypothetical protein
MGTRTSESGDGNMRILRDIGEFIELVILALYVEVRFLFKIGGRHGQKLHS